MCLLTPRVDMRAGASCEKDTGGDGALGGTKYHPLFEQKYVYLSFVAQRKYISDYLQRRRSDENKGPAAADWANIEDKLMLIFR